MEEFDKENTHVNSEKNQAILKIKNSFMCKLSFLILIRQNGGITK